MRLRAAEVAAVAMAAAVDMVAASVVDTPVGSAEALISAAGSVALASAASVAAHTSAASAAALTSEASVRAISAVLALLSPTGVWVSTSPRRAATSVTKRISAMAGASCRASMTMTTGATTRITRPTTAAIRGRIDSHSHRLAPIFEEGTSRAGALRCNQVVERVYLSIEHVETALTVTVVLAQGSGLARLHRLVEMVAVGAAALPGIGRVEAGLAHRCPAQARGSKLGALAAGWCVRRGPCRRKHQKNDGEAGAAQHECRSRQRDDDRECERSHSRMLSGIACRSLSSLARSCSKANGLGRPTIHLPRGRIEQAAAIHAKWRWGAGITFPAAGGGGRLAAGPKSR